MAPRAPRPFEERDAWHERSLKNSYLRWIPVLLTNLDPAGYGAPSSPACHRPREVLHRLWTGKRQPGVEGVLVAPTVADELGVEGLEDQSLAAALPSVEDVAQGGLDCGRVRPVSTEQDPSAAADQIGHVRQRTVELVAGAVQAVDQDRALDRETLLEGTGVGNLLI